MTRLSAELDGVTDCDDGFQRLTSLPALSSNDEPNSPDLKHAPRVQFSFTNVPKPIKEAFSAEAERRGITKKELLYECLRAGGVVFPDTSAIDGRRR